MLTVNDYQCHNPLVDHPEYSIVSLGKQYYVTTYMAHMAWCMHLNQFIINGTKMTVTL
jgi:hypothetical protein